MPSLLSFGAPPNNAVDGGQFSTDAPNTRGDVRNGSDNL